MSQHLPKRHSGLEDNRKNITHLQHIFEKNRGSEITRLYDLYRMPFIQFVVRKFQVEEDVAVDVYQESFMALYNNIREKKLTHLTCSLKTYLYRIGINKIYRHLEKTKNTDHLEEHDSLYDVADEASQEWVEMQEKIWDIVNKLQEPCCTVLNLYYWKQQTMREIAARLAYKNEQIAKNRKSLCLKTLREKINGLVSK